MLKKREFAFIIAIMIIAILISFINISSARESQDSSSHIKTVRNYRVIGNDNLGDINNDSKNINVSSNLTNISLIIKTNRKRTIEGISNDINRKDNPEISNRLSYIYCIRSGKSKSFCKESISNKKNMSYTTKRIKTKNHMNNKSIGSCIQKAENYLLLCSNEGIFKDLCKLRYNKILTDCNRCVINNSKKNLCWRHDFDISSSCEEHMKTVIGRTCVDEDKNTCKERYRNLVDTECQSFMDNCVLLKEQIDQKINSFSKRLNIINNQSALNEIKLLKVRYSNCINFSDDCNQFRIQYNLLKSEFDKGVVSDEKDEYEKVKKKIEQVYNSYLSCKKNKKIKSDVHDQDIKNPCKKLIDAKKIYSGYRIENYNSSLDSIRRMEQVKKKIAKYETLCANADIENETVDSIEDIKKIYEERIKLLITNSGNVDKRLRRLDNQTYELLRNFVKNSREINLDDNDFRIENGAFKLNGRMINLSGKKLRIKRNFSIEIGHKTVLHDNGFNITLKSDLSIKNNSLFADEEKILPISKLIKQMNAKDVKNIILENFQKPRYVIKARKKIKLFYLFPTEYEEVSTIDAIDGNLIGVKEPFWTIFAFGEARFPGITETGSLRKPILNICGNGACENIENVYNCPSDCNITCGDGICSGPCETKLNCIIDCLSVCGNGNCQSGENPYNCPYDCDTGCGDGICKGSENPQDCPQDCHGAILGGCGDGICTANENPEICPYDCEKFACGNHICEPGEYEQGCMIDCKNICGNHICEPGENYSNCHSDCGYSNDGFCDWTELNSTNIVGDCLKITKKNNGICEGGESNTTDCNIYNLKNCGNSICDSDENESICPGDCLKSCGDGICSIHESKLSCPSDCTNRCGDKICDAVDLRDMCLEDCAFNSSHYDMKRKDIELINDIKNPHQSKFFGKILGYNESAFCGDGECSFLETSKNCPEDCDAVCGDQVCDSHENHDTCPQDCTITCNNGYCEINETADTCPYDCNNICGDGVCTYGEDTSNCPIDCGTVICGDGICSFGETSYNCPLDCKPVLCGDAVCSHGESPDTCAYDCIEPEICGDGICEIDENETNCPLDCGYCGDGVCSPIEKGKCIFDCVSACGNSLCEKDETVLDCPFDCSS